MRVVLFRDASAYNFGRRRSGWKDKRKKARAMLVAFGALVVMSALAVFPSDSSWGSVYAIVGAVVVVAATWELLGGVGATRRAAGGGNGRTCSSLCGRVPAERLRGRDAVQPAAPLLLPEGVHGRFRGTRAHGVADPALQRRERRPVRPIRTTQDPGTLAGALALYAHERQRGAAVRHDEHARLAA